MSSARRWLGLALGALLTSSLGSVAAATPRASTPALAGQPDSVREPLAGGAPIIPVSQIRAGMTGYGLTVFRGTQPERFNIRVISVLHHFLPKQDIILIQSDDPRVLHTGIAAGMSGSPIYVEGRLAGALAYGWNFSKDPIAGVTPIENMLADVQRPRRGRDRTPLAQLMPAFRGPQHATDDHSTDALAMDRERRPQETGPLARLLPVLLPREADSRLIRAAVPLSVAGMSAGAVASLGEALAPFHMTPLQAGGGSPSQPSGPDRFTAGGAIAVQLIRGDISANGTGTVTFTQGDRVAAFGHPMFNVGEIYLPIATAEIHHILASQANSMKLSSPLRTLGSLTQDRQSCIVGDTAEQADMIPVRVAVNAPGQREHVFQTEVARHRFLTPMLTGAVATSAAQTAASDVAAAVIQVRSKVAVHGFEPLQHTDFVFSQEGLSARSLLTSTGMRQVNEILFNPFQPARIDQIDLAIQVEYRADVSELIAVSLASDELEPGTRPSLYVTLRPYNGAPFVRAVPFEVPRNLSGQTLKIEAAAGNQARPEIAPPENLEALVANLRKGYPARSLVITLNTPDEGAVHHGALVPSLPASVIATLRPGSSTRRADPYKRLARFVVDMGGVIQGKQELTVRVRDEIR